MSIKIEDQYDIWKKIENISLIKEKIVKEQKQVLHPDSLYEVGNVLEKFRTYIKD